MARRPQEPEERPGLHAGHDSDSKTFSHPAFGQIGASRVQGSSTLYGSDFVHQHYVVIRVSRSELNRDLHHDWQFAREELVELALSEAQWATFVSSMNVGSGVPCTLQRIVGEEMPGIPLRMETDVVKEEFDGRTRECAALVEAAIGEIEGEIGAALSKPKRERVLGRLKRLRQDLASNLPFVSKSFGEHMEKTVERAKVEVNAYLQSAVQCAGLAALGASDGPLALPSGDPKPAE